MVGLPSIPAAVAQTVSTVATPAAAPPPPPPAAEDVARFNSAMGSDTPDTAAMGSTSPGPTSPGPDGVQGLGGPGADATVTAVPAAGPASAPATTPGDAILQGLQRMNGGFHSSLDNVAKTLNGIQPGQAMSSADLLKAQMSLTQVTMQQDLTSKVVGKVTSNLDTFLKNG